ncbi:MAG TPA: hypothetical protein DCW68_07035 [Rhodospirillaceae bacterium]|nr:hypothetical protein [Rhodospirillaceae bacterium]
MTKPTTDDSKEAIEALAAALRQHVEEEKDIHAYGESHEYMHAANGVLSILEKNGFMVIRCRKFLGLKLLVRMSKP